MAEKWIFDNDGGIDDAYALVVALSDPSKMVIPIITVVGGSVPVEIAAKAVARTLEICKVKIPIYLGVNEGIIAAPDPVYNLMGSDGQGDAPEYATLQGYLDCIHKDLHAVQAIIDTVNKNAGEISLLATGPLTNIALAVKLDPSLPGKIKRFVVMGGAHHGKGNTTRAAEYNFHCDPEAAEICIQKFPFVEILTVENGYDFIISPEDYKAWHNVGTPKGRFLYSISRNIQKVLGRVDIYDPIAAAVAMNPKVVKDFIKAPCNVELHGTTTRGMLVIEWIRKAFPDLSATKPAEIFPHMVGGLHVGEKSPTIVLNTHYKEVMEILIRSTNC